MQFLKMTAFWPLAAMLLAGCGALRNGFHQSRVETTVRIYEQSDSALPAENVQKVALPRANLELAISPFPTLTERDVESAEVYNTAGGKAVFLRFDPHGEIVLDEMT